MKRAKRTVPPAPPALGVPAMDSGIKSRIIKICVVIVAVSAIGLTLVFTFPRNADLVMTPSTHQDIEYLTADKSQLGGNRAMQFVLYDNECSYLQFCIAVPKNDRELLQAAAVNISIDEKQIEEYSLISHTTWRAHYIMFLVNNVSTFSKISFTYGNQTIMAGRQGTIRDAS